MDDSIVERIQRLEDRFAIMDLVADYFSAIDDRDLEKFLALFTEDAVIRHRDGVMELRGRPAIREYYEARFRVYGVTFHYPHSHTVSLAGVDLARGVATGHAEMGLGGEAMIAAIRYTDQYARVDGRWRFSERVLACWYYLKMADLPSGLTQALRKYYKGDLLPAELPESLETYQSLHNRRP